MIQNTAEELAWLVQETERLVRNVEDMRLRIAEASKRRAGSSDEDGVETRDSTPDAGRTGPVTERAASAPTAERAASVPGSERAPSHVSVSKWLPPLSPARKPLTESGVYPILSDKEAGRYSIVTRRSKAQQHPSQAAQEMRSGEFPSAASATSEDLPSPVAAANTTRTRAAG